MKLVQWFSIAIVSIFILISHSAINAGGSIVLLQDDFNRANNQLLGIPWIEENEGFTTYQHANGMYLAPSFLEVADNSYAVHMESNPNCTGSCVSNHAHPYAYAPLNQAVNGLPLVMSLTLQPHKGERTGQVMGVMSIEDGFREIDPEPVSYYMPQNGLGAMVFRSAFNFSNSRMALFQFIESTEETIILAEEMLPFQLESLSVYSWEFTIHEDLTLSTTISGPQGTFMIQSEAVVIDYQMDHFYISTRSPGSGEHGYDSEPHILKLDNFLVTQDAVNLCSPSHETVPDFCPPVEVIPYELYLPAMFGCNSNINCIILKGLE